MQYLATATQSLENETAFHRPLGLRDSSTILFPQDKLQFANNAKNRAAAAVKHVAVHRVHSNDGDDAPITPGNDGDNTWCENWSNHQAADWGNEFRINPAPDPQN